eukprot:5735108-Prymnesium_polylepis.1
MGALPCAPPTGAGETDEVDCVRVGAEEDLVNRSLLVVGTAGSLNTCVQHDGAKHACDGRSVGAG